LPEENGQEYASEDLVGYKIKDEERLKVHRKTGGTEWGGGAMRPPGTEDQNGDKGRGEKQKKS